MGECCSTAPLGSSATSFFVFSPEGKEPEECCRSNRKWLKTQRILRRVRTMHSKIDPRIVREIMDDRQPLGEIICGSSIMTASITLAFARFAHLTRLVTTNRYSALQSHAESVDGYCRWGITLQQLGRLLRVLEDFAEQYRYGVARKTTLGSREHVFGTLWPRLETK